MDRNHQKNLFTHVQGDFGPIWGLCDDPETQKSSLFYLSSLPVGTMEY